MQILPEWGTPYIVDSLTSPLATRYNWVFNAQLVDFMLSPIQYLEETTGAAVKVRINGTEFWVPSSWYILVTDRDTYQLETVQLSTCASNKYLAFAFCSTDLCLRTLDIRVLDYAEDISVVHPMIQKGTGMCHPVGPAARATPERPNHLSVVIGPYDLYKFLAGVAASEVFAY